MIIISFSLETITETTLSVLSLTDIDGTENGLLNEESFYNAQSKGRKRSSGGKITQKKKKVEVIFYYVLFQIIKTRHLVIFLKFLFRIDQNYEKIKMD